MFGIFNKPDRYNELFQHLTTKWYMKNGYAAVFLNEYRNAVSKQYEKAVKQTHNGFLSSDPESLELAYNEIAEWALVSQAHHVYMSDLRSGKNVGTNVELAIWAILLARIDLVEATDRGLATFISNEQKKRFPDLFQDVFNDPLA
jgi:hypothetical protein